MDNNDEFLKYKSDSVNDEFGKFKSDTSSPEKQSDSLPTKIANTALAGAGALGSGAAIVGAGKWMVDPFIQRAQLHNTRILPFMQQHSIPAGIPVSDIPKAIQNRITQASKESTLASRQFSNQLQQFDSSTKNGVVKDVANNVAQNYSAWRKSGWEAYGNGLKDIENTLEKTGINFDPQAFNQNVIQKTADTLASRGLTKEADNLRNYSSSRASSLVDAEGNPNTQPISFTNAKQAITELSNQNPSAARELKANWGNHLQNDPVISQVPEVSTKLQSLNQSYTPFKQADNVAYKLVDPNTGGLSTKKITDAIHSYVKGNGDPQTTTFLKTLGNNSSMATPIQGLSNQADSLDALAQQRQGLLNLSKQTQVNNTQKIVNLGNAKMQADEFASLDKGLNGKILNRKIVGGTGVALAGAHPVLEGIGKALGVLSVAPQLLGVAQAYQSSQSRPNSNLLQGVTDMAYSSATGNNLSEVQRAAQKALGYGNATNEDMNTLRNAGVTQQDLDNARKAFGVT